MIEKIDNILLAIQLVALVGFFIGMVAMIIHSVLVSLYSSSSYMRFMHQCLFYDSWSFYLFWISFSVGLLLTIPRVIFKEKGLVNYTLPKSI